MGAWLVLALAFLVLSPLGAQDARALTEMFGRYFEQAGDLDARAVVVRDAVASGVPGMGPFYGRVLEFVAGRGAEVQADRRLQEMASLAAARVAKEKHREARAAAWQVFESAGDLETRLRMLEALAATAAGDGPLVAGIAAFLDEQNRLFAAGRKPDPRLVLAVVGTLGSLADPAALSSLFNARVAGHSPQITAAADEALLANHGDLREFLAAVVRSGSPVERRDAFALAVAAARIDAQAKAALAEDALRAALAMPTAAEETVRISRELRASAVAVLESARWSRASPLAVEHFSAAALEYDRGQVGIGYLVAAVNGLGAMGTHEAAERLTAYLETLNSRRELGKPCDEQIVVAVIAALARLEDKSAFATLSYARYLDYSDKVKQAASDAITRLKW